MRLRRFLSALCGCALVLCFAAFLHAQEITGNIVGTVVDSSGAVVPGATVKLTDVATSAVRTAQSGAQGIFRFPNLSQGTYIATISANGFQQHNVTNIELNASSTLDLGKIALQVGSQSQEVSVTAAATPIQTSSSEVSHTITGSALNALPLVGRDVFSAMSVDAGVINTNPNMAGPNEGDIGNITIDGNTSAKNFTVDGVTDMDTGSNGTTHYEPNMGAIQEVKILSSNYDAEYGRNSGGTITVITKSGTSKLHGSAWFYHRHEQFNANTFFNNAQGLPRAIYRYNIDGYALGGPVPFGWFKNKLFWFGSQEFTHQIGANQVEAVNLPTCAERGLTGGSGTTCGTTQLGYADFSGLVDGKGNPITIFNPATGLPFPNNQIPAASMDANGQAMLNFFPAPNYTPTANTQINQVNFQQQASSPHPHRNDVLRIDFNPTSKLTSYFRWIRDADDTTSNFNGQPFLYAPIDHPNPGHGYAWSATYVLSPTLINTVTVGKSWNTWSWYFLPGSLQQQSRTATLNPPTLFALPTSPSGVNGYSPLLPQFNFANGGPASGGGVNGDIPNMAYHNVGGVFNYYNANNIWTVDDDVSKVIGPHQVKTGIYVEYNTKLQPAGNGYSGVYNFAADPTNPNSTAGSCVIGTAGCTEYGVATQPAANTTFTSNGDGYANAMLGLFDTYNQSTARTVFNVAYWNVEFYVQDSWRVNKKLTLDAGVRFYHQTPQVDQNGTFGEFVPSQYINLVKTMPTQFGQGILYVPGCDNNGVYSDTTSCAKANQVAVDPNNPTVTHGPAAYIGAFLPSVSTYFGSGAYDGMQTVAANQAPYTNSGLVAAPRIGFAYDVFGNGKTALRGGFGVFYNRLDGNQVYNMSGQPPLNLTYSVSQGSMANLANTAGVIAPTSINYYSGTTPIPVVKNASLGWEQEMGWQTALDVSWVGNFSTEQPLRENMNAVPLGANFNNVSPVTGSALTQNNSALERTQYPGYLDLNQEVFYGHSNYNSLQVSLSHRLANGVLFGAAYTWSRALGVTSYDPLVANNNARNYGPLSTNRDQVLTIHYSWALPGVGHNAAGSVLNDWTFSGLTTFSTGAPYSPSFSSPTDYTGSASESARLNVVSNPLQNVPTGYIFNPAAFTQPSAPNGTPQLGNLGVNAFNYPGYNDWDMSFAKFIPLGFTEGSGLQVQFEGFNVFNHPQFNAWGTNLNSAKSFGIATGTLPARVIAFNLDYKF